MAAVGLEPAIQSNLKQERIQPSSLPSADYQPPFPAYSSRFQENTQDLVLAIFGAQHNSKENRSSNALSTLVAFVKNNNVETSGRPLYWLLASSTDTNGAYNEVVITYWSRKSDYNVWLAQSGFDAWWQDLSAHVESNGWFKEIFYPPLDRLETVFSTTDAPEGVAHMHENFSGSIQEHVYWGSMRDRLPVSQVDDLKGTKLKHLHGNDVPADATVDTNQAQIEDKSRGRVRVSGMKNLAIIRSGQDWSATTPHERKLYLDTMHPVLIRGMDFLRDQGNEVGCICNRFMSVLDPNTLSSDSVEKTFGLGYFDDLSSLEYWSKKHKTHLDIFGRFLQYAKELQGDVSLRLFHEVLVLMPEQQEFEYVGCHSKTGMMASLCLQSE